MTDELSKLVKLALRLGKKYKVFPSAGKAPAWSNADLAAKGYLKEGAKGGYHIATGSNVLIMILFAHDRATNVGMPCRINKLAVVDVDKGGEQWMQDNMWLLKDTLCHSTPSGGYHFVFEDPGIKLPGKLHPKVDLKVNGYVNWPGAGGYKVHTKNEIKPFPVELLSGPKQKLNGKGHNGPPSDRGQHEHDLLAGLSFHDPMTALAATYVSDGLSEKDVLKKLWDMLERCDASSESHDRHGRWSGIMESERNELEDCVSSAVAKFDPVPVGMTPDKRHLELIEEMFAPPEPEPEYVEQPVAAPSGPSSPLGLVGRIAAFSASCGYYKSPVGDIVAGLLTISTLSSNRAMVEYDNRATALNLYVLLAAPSGSGKENARGVIEELIDRFEDLAPEYWDGMPSIQGLARGLNKAREHSGLLAIDEYGHHLKSAGNDNGGHQKELMTGVMKIYGLSQRSFRPKVYASEKNDIPKVEKPFLNLLGTTTMEALLPALYSQQVVDGFLNRHVLFEGSYIGRNRNGDDILPDSLLSDLSAWRNALKGNTKVRCLKKAEKRLHEWDLEVEKHRIEGDPLYARTFENTLKLAGIVALGDGGKVTKEHVEWAIATMKVSQFNMRERVADKMLSESANEMQDKIKAYLKKAGWKTRRQCHQRFHNDVELFKKAFNNLLDAGLLQERKKGKLVEFVYKN